jgi:hypothetical protein
MWEKIRDILVMLAPYVRDYIAEYRQKRRARPRPLPPGARLPWNLTVVVMDGTDLEVQAKIPVAEAVSFIEARTRFDFNVRYVETEIEHDFTPYPSDIVRYAMMGWNVPETFIQTLPVSSSYLFLYKLFGNEAAQAGSALGLDFGLKIGGKPRPYATVATDQRWYVNTPMNGFDSWAAQILTHEIINTIQAKIEAPPYNCGQLIGTPDVRSDIHENERLQKLTDQVYAALGDNAD